MNTEELENILRLHKMWLAGNKDGVKVNLSHADLRYANLREADLYMTTWPLWCGSKNARIDISIASQLAAHFCCLRCDDPEYQKAKEALLPLAKKFKYAKDLGL